jgi:hypothetical protein
MNTPQPIKISIPVPCHEDWNKMTPNEKGSFCSKCSKTVVDFTQKSPDEITTILLKSASNKVCGRFMTEQLTEPEKQMVNLYVPLYALPKHVSYNKSFAIAIFMAFGTTLFSCSTHQNETVGEIQTDTTHNVISVEKTKDTVVSAIHKKTTENKPNNRPQMLLGAVCIKPVVPQKNEAIHVKGDVALKTDTIQSQKNTPTANPPMGKIKVHR